jgi:hypothetical protein
MPNFRKKPVVIEAVQLTWDTWSEVCDFVGADGIRGLQAHEVREIYPAIEVDAGKIYALIPTLEGLHLATQDDWIIRGIKGELYPCKPDIFAATYEPASEQESPTQSHRRSTDFETESEFILYALERLMSQQDDLNTAVAKLQADVSTLTGTVTTLTSAVTSEVTTQQTEIANLQAQLASLQAGNPTIDLSAAIASVNAIDASVGNITAAVQAATPGAAPAPSAPAATDTASGPTGSDQGGA